MNKYSLSDVNIELLIYGKEFVLKSFFVKFLYLLHAFFYRPTYIFFTFTIFNKFKFFTNKKVEDLFRINIWKLSFESYKNNAANSNDVLFELCDDRIVKKNKIEDIPAKIHKSIISTIILGYWTWSAYMFGQILLALFIFSWFNNFAEYIGLSAESFQIPQCWNSFTNIKFAFTKYLTFHF